MAIRLEEKESGEIQITLSNGHCNFIENVRKRYNFTNQAEALDFLLKAVGNDDAPIDNLIVAGINYVPEGYDRKG